MAFSVEIKCINKSDRQSAHECIKSVGGVNADGTKWKLSLTEAISSIETEKYTFWTKGGGKTVDVIVATNNGNKYLKTKNDGVRPDNLLSLPECN